MPAKLTPEHERAERRSREALDDAERMAALQEMVAVIPKHEGPEKLQAELKRRLSQLRTPQQKAGPSNGADPFHFPTRGVGQVVLAGPPNTGESRLLVAKRWAWLPVDRLPGEYRIGQDSAAGRRQTTVAPGWIAQRLQMGGKTHLGHLLTTGRAGAVGKEHDTIGCPLRRMAILLTPARAVGRFSRTLRSRVAQW